MAKFNRPANWSPNFVTGVPVDEHGKVIQARDNSETYQGATLRDIAQTPSVERIHFQEHECSYLPIFCDYVGSRARASPTGVEVRGSIEGGPRGSSSTTYFAKVSFEDKISERRFSYSEEFRQEHEDGRLSPEGEKEICGSLLVRVRKGISEDPRYTSMPMIIRDSVLYVNQPPRTR